VCQGSLNPWSRSGCLIPASVSLFIIMPTPSGSSMSDIFWWLDEVPLRHRLRSAHQRPAKRRRMSATPSKRPASGGLASESPATGDPLKQPRRGSSLHPLSLPPSLPPSGSSQRSKSPTKSVADLGRFALPVEYQPPLPTVRLPDPIRSLDTTLTKISRGVGIYPLSLKVCPYLAEGCS